MGKIIVLEDNTLFAEIVCRWLQKEGWKTELNATHEIRATNAKIQYHTRRVLPEVSTLPPDHEIIFAMMIRRTINTKADLWQKPATHRGAIPTL